jgi:hypothetical protein
MADLVALVIGFAIAFALPIPYGIPEFAIPMAEIFFYVIGALVFWPACATTAVVFWRRMEFGGKPRAGEWLCILLTMWLISESTYGPDTLVRWIIRLQGQGYAYENEYRYWRWCIASGCFAGLLGGVPVAFLLRRRPLLHTALLSLLAFLLLWGPINVLEMQFAPSLPRLRNDWAFWIVSHLVWSIRDLPFRLLFGVPWLATFMAWRRGDCGHWIWTEWIGGAVATGLGLFWTATICLEGVGWPIASFVGEKLATAVNLLVVLILSLWLRTVVLRTWR